MAGYEDVHTGDVVVGHDGELWGVQTIVSGPPLSVTLVRHGTRVTGQPPAGTEVTIHSRADVSAEAYAFGLLASAFGDVALIGEHWES